MYRNSLVAAVLIPSLIGCTPSNPSEVSNGTIIGWLEEPSVNTSAHYMGLNGRIVLVVWSDVVGSSRSNSTSSAKGVTLNGDSTSKDDRKLVWKCDATADGAGTLTLGDSKYDLADGCIFLVSMRNGSSNIQQVSRETIATSTIARRVRELKREEEITAFFSQQAPENGT
jgi:hypothetical protein